METAVPGESSRVFISHTLFSHNDTPAPPEYCPFPPGCQGAQVSAPCRERGEREVGNQRLRSWGTNMVQFAGMLYQRTVIAEQNLMSELYPYQER
jgi:hypothetical protein